MESHLVQCLVQEHLKPFLFYLLRVFERYIKFYKSNICIIKEEAFEVLRQH